MILTSIANLLINLLNTFLGALSLPTNFITNIFANSQFTSLLKVVTMFFTQSTLVFLINTFIFWTTLFIRTSNSKFY